MDRKGRDGIVAISLNSSWMGRALIVAASAYGLALSAHAADDPCQMLGKALSGRAQIIQEVQSFREKKPTADQACATFTKLSKINVTAVAAVERDGAWCRAPEDLAANLKSQQAEIDKGKQNACKVAADMKKAQKKWRRRSRTFWRG